jgi:hypothetical protein
MCDDDNSSASTSFRLCLAVPTTVDDAMQAAQIAVALTWSFREGKVVEFDEQSGEPILV